MRLSPLPAGLKIKPAAGVPKPSQVSVRRRA